MSYIKKKVISIKNICSLQFDFDIYKNESLEKIFFVNIIYF